MTFNSLQQVRERLGELTNPSEHAIQEARKRNDSLTKPPGSLGRLEEIAVWLAGWQGSSTPKIENCQVLVFAGNHGVAARGVSAFPSVVTEQMVMNFQAGGAAVNQLSSLAGACLDVIPLDLDSPTKDFTLDKAMSEEEICQAISIGWDSVRPDSDAVALGEMGIGNTTSASAILQALFSSEAEEFVGRGTGVDDQGLDRKKQVVAEGVQRHSGLRPLETLQALGGREIAAMAGAILKARELLIPVVLDGFICCSAASVLHCESGRSLDHCIPGHVSAEAAHRWLLNRLGLEPLLDLGMRLGEASGASLGLMILKAACACHSGMATFEQAGVSEG